MIQVLLSIVLLALLIRGGGYLLRKAKARRLHGKNFHRAIEAGRVSEEIRDLTSAAWCETEEKLSTRRKPYLSNEQLLAVMRAEYDMREDYLDHKMKLTFYQGTIIFVIGSVGGLLMETVWMYVTVGLLQSRVGTVWGPFSPLYGFGAVFFTIVGWNLRRKHARWWVVLLLSVAVGGLLEQFTGWAMQSLFDAQSWTYLGLPDAITLWVSWRSLAAWGAIGMIWRYMVMPEVLYRIGVPTTRRQIIVVGVLAAWLTCDLLMTMAVFSRKSYRDMGIAPQTPLQVWIDQHYTDTWIEGRFQNLVVGQDLGPNL
jgi:uncharacterized membrane protein